MSTTHAPVKKKAAVKKTADTVSSTAAADKAGGTNAPAKVRTPRRTATRLQADPPKAFKCAVAQIVPHAGNQFVVLEGTFESPEAALGSVVQKPGRYAIIPVYDIPEA